MIGKKKVKKNIRIHHECEINPEDHCLASRGLQRFCFKNVNKFADLFSCNPTLYEAGV